MIVDIHVHHWLGPKAGEPRARLDEVLTLADLVGIDHLCLMGNVSRFGVRCSRAQVAAINDDTLALAHYRPDRVLGFCFLSPLHGRRFIRAEMDRCIRDGGLRGVKLWVDVKAGDRRLDPVMERAAELGVPVLQHTWYKSVDKDRRASEPCDVAELAARFPQTTIIMAHLMGGGMRGVLDIQPYANVLVDTTGSQPQAGMVEYAVERLGAGRVVFGSDLRVRDFPCQLGKVYGARISKRAKRMILGLNAARLLKLERP